MRHAKKAATIWFQSDFCARVKGSSDEAPVTYEHPETQAKSTHGTADGRKACLHHCLSLGVARSSSPGSMMIVQLRRVCPRSLGERQVSWTESVAS